MREQLPRNSPPRWATRLLRWYCRRELVEDLEGDLNEYFDRHVARFGLRKAKAIYIANVFKFFRHYTVRKPEFLNLLIHWIMLHSYIKTSGRSIVRNKLFSSINIIGLAISMSVGLLMIAFLGDLLSYDRFHTRYNRIYRVSSTRHSDSGDVHGFASTSLKTGRLISENIAGVENLVTLRKGFSEDARVGDNIVPIDGFWASEAFFDVFSFPLVEGNYSSALKNPYSIVLTESSAKKLFGSTSALGKTVVFDTVDYEVTGVMKDVPKFSHIQFESLISLSSFEQNPKNKKRFDYWNDMWENYVYLVLPEGTRPEDVQQKLDKLSATENASLEHAKIMLWLQPMKDVVLGRDLSNSIGLTMEHTMVWIIGALAFIVMLSACFNYTNLSIARAFRRSREVGIRKVIGALRGDVLAQFLAEAVMIALLALALSLGFFLALRPFFLSISPNLSRLVSLELSWQLVLSFIALAIMVGLIAGLLPAVFFSRINAIQVLRNLASFKVFRHVTVRKALITIQYTLSLVFIAATFIGYKQYRYFLTIDLGFNTANILNIGLQGNKPDAFVNALKELPEVNGVSGSQMVTSVGNYWSTGMKYIDPTDSITVYYNAVDEHYLPLHGHKLLAGRNFTPAAPDAQESEVIVNEQVLKHFHIGQNDPRKAVGEMVTVNLKKMQIIGVVKDFHYGKVDSPIEPVVFRYLAKPEGYVNVSITSTDLSETMKRIEAAWKSVDRIHPIDAHFYDEQIERAYSEFSAMLKILGFLAILAVSIASMGLLGMVVFTTETRLREVSIRKVMGASMAQLVYLLSRGFLLLLGLAALIALPATYLFFDRVVLTFFAYHAPLGIAELAISLGLVLIIAFFMMSSQMVKVARSNPAEVLKGE